MVQYSLSVGYLNNSVYLLKLISSPPDITLDELKKIVDTDDILLRETQTVVVQSAIEFGWIEIGPENKLTLNDGLTRTLFDRGDISVQRELLWLYIFKSRPFWTKYLGHGISTAKHNISNDDEKQIFIDLGLFVDAEDSDKDVVDWWSRVAGLTRQMEDEKLTEIGNKGEFLSIRFERNRTGVRPTHMALDSNHHGYDILSQIDSSNSDPLHIEVKASISGWRGGVLHLTRNEYDKSRESGVNYQFHLWDISSENPKLLIVSSLDMLQHAPIDSGKGRWETVAIKFKSFNWDECIDSEEGVF